MKHIKSYYPLILSLIWFIPIRNKCFMKNLFNLSIFILLCFSISSCKNKSTANPNPFDIMAESSNDSRDKIVVISDLHLGNDLTYSETVDHLGRLEEFLTEVRRSKTVKELVIAGDMFDDWYIPANIEAYGGGTQADFVRKSVNANKGVFDVLNRIIKEKRVKVTYIPGNHDMGFTEESVNIAMPGVNQARDGGNKFGNGTYYPDGYPEIAIEHGHRYDFFCSLTPGENEHEAPGSKLPPGYFFARIAATSFVNPTTPEDATKVRTVTLNNPEDPEQYSKFIYYSLWKKVIEEVIYVKENFNEPVIKTYVGNFTKTYSINDIIPENSEIDGKIQMNLYNGMFTQTNWNSRLAYNNVSVITDINKAIVGSLNTEFLDDQSEVQYFQNPLSKVRVVIFGHTHLPMVRSYTNMDGKDCIYANSGTWEDLKTRDKGAVIDQDEENMNFIVVAPVNSDKKRLHIGLYQYKYGKHVLGESSEISL